MRMRQRFYINGKLHDTAKPVDAATARKWLDNAQRQWTKDGLFPLTIAGDFDCNKCHTFSRVSEDELLVTNTKGSVLRWVNVAVKETV